MQTYAVLWSEAAGPVRAGKLELGEDAIRLEGAAARTIPYNEIAGLRVARGLAERIQGRPSLVIDLAGGGKLRIGSLAGPGTLHELAEKLLALVPAPAVP
jgi:superfamily II helicase